MYRYLALLFLCSFSFLSAEVKEKDFNAPLTDAEKKNISYIITTLANNSMFKLMFYQGELNQAGENISHVHPLKILEYAFTNPTLKKDIKKISGTPWNRFVQGIAKSIQNEVAKKEMKLVYVTDFSKAIGVSESLLEPYVKSGQWVAFINTARDHLPNT